jgi:hypothetical protein
VPNAVEVRPGQVSPANSQPLTPFGVEKWTSLRAICAPASLKGLARRPSLVPSFKGAKEGTVLVLDSYNGELRILEGRPRWPRTPCQLVLRRRSWSQCPPQGIMTQFLPDPRGCCTPIHADHRRPGTIAGIRQASVISSAPECHRWRTHALPALTPIESTSRMLLRLPSSACCHVRSLQVGRPLLPKWRGEGGLTQPRARRDHHEVVDDPPCRVNLHPTGSTALAHCNPCVSAQKVCYQILAWSTMPLWRAALTAVSPPHADDSAHPTNGESSTELVGPPFLHIRPFICALKSHHRVEYRRSRPPRASCRLDTTRWPT